MSALGVSEYPQPQLGMWATRDPVLACTLGSLGFPARGTLPIMIAYDAKRIVQVTKSGVTNEGGMNDLATVEINFVYEIQHPQFGRLTCSMIHHAHELAKLKQKKEVGGIDNAELARLAELATRTSQAGMTDGVLFAVQLLYDHICNWNVLCESVQELNKNPFLRFSRSLKKNGVAVTLNPLECETTAARRNERLFREA